MCFSPTHFSDGEPCRYKVVIAQRSACTLQLCCRTGTRTACLRCYQRLFKQRPSVLPVKCWACSSKMPFDYEGAASPAPDPAQGYGSFLPCTQAEPVVLQAASATLDILTKCSWMRRWRFVYHGMRSHPLLRGRPNPRCPNLSAANRMRQRDRLTQLSTIWRLA